MDPVQDGAWPLVGAERGVQYPASGVQEENADGDQTPPAEQVSETAAPEGEYPLLQDEPQEPPMVRVQTPDWIPLEGAEGRGQ